MELALWLHTPTNARYIVLLTDGIVQQAAGPLDGAQLAAAQADEWSVPWVPGLAAWVEQRRGEFVELHPRMGQSQ
jgi:hypothetical protein